MVSDFWTPLYVCMYVFIIKVNPTMTIKIYFPLSAVRIFCAVCIGNTVMLKKQRRKYCLTRTNLSNQNTNTMQLCKCLALTSAHVLCVWSCVTSLLRIVLITSPPCMLRHPMIFQSINSNNDHAWQDYILWSSWENLIWSLYSIWSDKWYVVCAGVK